MASAIRELILSGELPSGTRLLQADMAERFGVSTTPVREAFTALARQGIVRQDPHRGVVVFEPSLAELEENYLIRIALEGLAVSLAAPRIDTDTLDELDALQDDLEQIDDGHRRAQLNRRFHARMYDAADRPTLAGMIENLREAATNYLALTVQEPDEAYQRRTADEHRAILAALRAGDAQDAAYWVQEHLRQNQEHVARLITGRVAAGLQPHRDA